MVASINFCICQPDLHYPKNIDELNNLFEKWKNDREGVVNDTDSVAAKHVYRQTQKLGWLIAMDDVSCLAGESNLQVS